MSENVIINLDYGFIGVAIVDLYKVMGALYRSSRGEFVFRLMGKEYKYKNGRLYLYEKEVLLCEREVMHDSLRRVRCFLETKIFCVASKKDSFIIDPDVICKTMALDWLNKKFPNEEFHLQPFRPLDYEMAAWVVNDDYVIALKHESFVNNVYISNHDIVDNSKNWEDSMLGYVTDSFNEKFLLLYVRKEVALNSSFDEIVSFLNTIN